MLRECVAVFEWRGNIQCHSPPRTPAADLCPQSCSWLTISDQSVMPTMCFS